MWNWLKRLFGLSVGSPKALARRSATQPPFAGLTDLMDTYAVPDATALLVGLLQLRIAAAPTVDTYYDSVSVTINGRAWRVTLTKIVIPHPTFPHTRPGTLTGGTLKMTEVGKASHTVTLGLEQYKELDASMLAYEQRCVAAAELKRAAANQNVALDLVEILIAEKEGDIIEAAESQEGFTT